MLDAYGDKSDFAEVGRIHDEDAARLQHLEIRHAELVITIPTLRLIPDNHTSSGMDSLNYFLLKNDTIARRMEAMVIKNIENEVRCLTTYKPLSIRTIAQ